MGRAYEKRDRRARHLQSRIPCGDDAGTPSRVPREKERLLGVSITGQWDSPAVRDTETLQRMRDAAIAANAKYAKRFGVPVSMSVTAVKPSGTVSQTFNCSSGLHPRHAKHYIRRVRI